MASYTELVKLAQDRDENALASLLERFGPELLKRLTGQIPLQWRSVLSEEDVLQQTYIDAFLDIGRFKSQGEGSFLAWLTQLANRNLIDAIRTLDADKRGGGRRRISPRSDESYVALYDYLGGSSTTPSRRAARNEAKAAIAEAIQQLPQDYRLVVQLYDLSGQPLLKVAETLKRTPGATSMLRARAHRRLAEILGTASRFLSRPA